MYVGTSSGDSFAPLSTTHPLIAYGFGGNDTITAVGYNDSIFGGDGDDILNGGGGNDLISGGSGKDQITGGAGVDDLTGGGGRDAFIIVTANHSSIFGPDKIADFGKVTAAATATDTADMNSVANFQAKTFGGSDADLLDFAATATLAGAATGIDVAEATGNAGKVITASISTKGVITLSGADAGLVNSLAKWGDVAVTLLANANVAVFEFSGNTYVFQEGSSTDIVELTGVTGVTGIVLAGSSVAAAVGDIYVI